MPVTQWRCPACGETWHTSREANCGACLMDRRQITRGVPVQAAPAKTHEPLTESLMRDAIQSRGEVT